MKRILIFSLAYYPKFVGGAEVAIKEITDRLGKEGFSFEMITLRFDSDLPKEEKIGSVIVHRVGWGRKGVSIGQTFSLLFYISKILFVPLAAWKAYQLHRKNRFDVFWAMMSYMLFPIVLLRFAGVRPPYVLSLQEGDPFERVYRRPHIALFLPLLRFGFKRAAAVTALSTYLAKWARHMGFAGPLTVVPNAADIQHFSQAYPQAAIDGVRDELDKKMGDVFLITTSRLVHKNAVDDVIRALPLLPEQVRFIVLGTGPDELPLKKLALKLGVTSRVNFIGHVDHADMPKYLQASDIFVRPSRTEGFGASFPEAMAAGLPVVATQEGGIADFLFDEKRNSDMPITGFAVDKDSPEQIAQAVRRVMENPEKTRAIVRTALEMVREKYDWSVIARQMQTVFENCS